LAGQAGGYLKTGECIDAKGYNHNQLLTTMMQAFGSKENFFGVEGLGTGVVKPIVA